MDPEPSLSTVAQSRFFRPQLPRPRYQQSWGRLRVIQLVPTPECHGDDPPTDYRKPARCLIIIRNSAGGHHDDNGPGDEASYDPRQSTASSFYLRNALVGDNAVWLGALILRHDAARTSRICQVCNRPVHARMGYRLELAKTSETACCPRCGMHYELSHPGMVKRAFARDFYTGAEFPAEKAYYVDGGNEVYCAHVQPVERKELESAADLAFDRCTPPLVAFATEDGANKYRAKHGGRLLRYEEAVERVRQR